jgi:hypothetical protein
MSVVEELAELLAEDGTYEAYPGPDGIALYRFACRDCVPYQEIWIDGDDVSWGKYQFSVSQTGLEDLAQAILCTLRDPENFTS